MEPGRETREIDLLTLEEKTHDSNAEHDENCISCGLDFSIVLPSEIVESAHRRDLVIFAGAGISTETPAVFPDNFYQTVAADLGYQDPTQSFPELMQEFQDKFGRVKLIGKLKDRFNYVNSFRSSRFESVKFHRELSTMPYLKEVITTNWDTYFEEECSATPYVRGEDFAFIDFSGRKVYKMHGSIGLLSSIIITENDYAKSIEELSNNVLGSTVRNLMATKTVVFIGYSLSDWNFQRIYGALRADMGDYWRPAYVVTPFQSAAVETNDLIHLKTSGQQFLKILKDEMVGHCFLPDSQYEYVRKVELDVRAANEIAASFQASKFPTIVHCWAYQEGLRDACARIIDLRSSGIYSDAHHVQNRVRTYDAFIEQALSENKYFTAAYMEGYQNGLLVMLDTSGESIEAVPMYYIYGSDSDMRSIEELKEALQQSKRRAPKPRAEAKQLSANIPDGMILTHGPTLRIDPNKA